jgi:hypothetical protein
LAVSQGISQKLIITSWGNRNILLRHMRVSDYHRFISLVLGARQNLDFRPQLAIKLV